MLDVLHNSTPTNGRRRGYRTLDTDDVVSETSPLRGEDDGFVNTEQELTEESGQKDNWMMLTWSFALSSLMTVRFDGGVHKMLMCAVVDRILLSSRFCTAIFWKRSSV